MTDERDALRREGIGLEPEDLDGQSMERLSEYLDAGRTPPDPAIDNSPGCQIALDALERLRGLTPRLFADDVAAEPAVDEGWMAGLMGLIALDARAGRRIPISSEFGDLGITEGAVRGEIRAAEAAVPGALIGRTRLHGDVTVPGASVRVALDVSAPYGVPIDDTVERLRAEVWRRLHDHTELTIEGIDITVHDIHLLPSPEEER